MTCTCLNLIIDIAKLRPLLYPSRLMKEYKIQAARLRQTGGGIGDDMVPSAEDGIDNDNGMSGHCSASSNINFTCIAAETRLAYYIPPEGPSLETPVEAVNLWGTCQTPYMSFRDTYKVRQRIFVPSLNSSHGSTC